MYLTTNEPVGIANNSFNPNNTECIGTSVSQSFSIKVEDVKIIS